MQPIGLLIEFKNGRIKDASYGLAAAALGKQRRLFALVIDAPVDEAARKLQNYGVDRIVAVDTGASGWNAAVHAEAVIAAMRQFGIEHLVGLTSPTGRELLPRIAAGLDAPLIMDCIDIDLEQHRVRTSQYSGKTVAAIQMSGSRFIYGLRPNALAPIEAPAEAQIIGFPFTPTPDPAYQVIETRSDDSGDQYLAEADVILSGGRGMKNAENFKLLFDCARHINASVGASRVAVDNDWVPYAMQVGQTGVKVNPKVYIAAGISGSIQHFAGMKTAGTIIAINTDENAPIMAKCDYYAVADLFDVLPELEKALGALGA
ncbi:MAG TPA: electron transfer flavoprotein subunit alpha/FixB family protein [Desulfosarcina sp.]|nr:electron transfer flavoprotein subunit alpha/FixB family protein [Desulfosarcina sp.]